MNYTAAQKIALEEAQNIGRRKNLNVVGVDYIGENEDVRTFVALISPYESITIIVSVDKKDGHIWTEADFEAKYANDERESEEINQRGMRRFTILDVQALAIPDEESINGNWLAITLQIDDRIQTLSAIFNFMENYYPDGLEKIFMHKNFAAYKEKFTDIINKFHSKIYFDKKPMPKLPIVVFDLENEKAAAAPKFDEMSEAPDTITREEIEDMIASGREFARKLGPTALALFEGEHMIEEAMEDAEGKVEVNFEYQGGVDEEWRARTEVSFERLPENEVRIILKFDGELVASDKMLVVNNQGNFRMDIPDDLWLALRAYKVDIKRLLDEIRESYETDEKAGQD